MIKVFISRLHNRVFYDLLKCVQDLIRMKLVSIVETRLAIQDLSKVVHLCYLCYYNNHEQPVNELKIFMRNGKYS